MGFTGKGSWVAMVSLYQVKTRTSSTSTSALTGSTRIIESTCERVVCACSSSKCGSTAKPSCSPTPCRLRRNNARPRGAEGIQTMEVHVTFIPRPTASMGACSHHQDAVSTRRQACSGTPVCNCLRPACHNQYGWRTFPDCSRLRLYKVSRHSETAW
jgi:hypothetical protein